MSRLIEHLRSLDRKERFAVLHDALGFHPEAPRLDEGFREKLATCIGRPVPAYAFLAMDYHLDWIRLALYLAENPHIQPETPCMDAPLNASNFFGHAGQCDQVLSCIRPLDAASQRAAGQYGDTRTRSKSIFRALSPAQIAGFPGPVSMIVCPYLSSVLLTSTTPSRQAATTQAAAVTGSR